MYKKVLMPIIVPDNDYCWDGHVSCDHFDNPGGHGQCDLDFDPKKTREGIYLKPKECQELENG